MFNPDDENIIYDGVPYLEPNKKKYINYPKYLNYPEPFKKKYINPKPFKIIKPLISTKPHKRIAIEPTGTTVCDCCLKATANIRLSIDDGSLVVFICSDCIALLHSITAPLNVLVITGQDSKSNSTPHNGET